MFFRNEQLSPFKIGIFVFAFDLNHNFSHWFIQVNLLFPIVRSYNELENLGTNVMKKNHLTTFFKGLFHWLHILRRKLSFKRFSFLLRCKYTTKMKKLYFSWKLCSSQWQMSDICSTRICLWPKLDFRASVQSEILILNVF